MVRSKLDRSVEYNEIRGIDLEDEEYESPVYEIELMGYVVQVGLGKAKYAQINNDIVYYPVYLLSQDKVVNQVGVVEALNSDMPNLFDTEGDPDLSKMNEPLLYDFIEPLLFDKYAAVLEDELSESVIKKTGKESEDEDFIPSQDDVWVQSFFKDKKYGIIDNEGGGDCFFAALRDGLATIGKTVTVAELRHRISTAATPEIYQTYRTIYEDAARMVEDVNARIKSYMEQIKNLKNTQEKATNRQEKALIIKQANDIKNALKEAKNEKVIVSKNVLEPFKWMAKLNSYTKFVKAIRTCSFWADEWAISLVERLYNIKVIILSEESFKEGDIQNVLRCGEGDKELLEKGMFRPADYIILAHTGDHYKLVTYDGKGAFTYNNLPRNLVNEIREKCMERNAGLFSIIPEFKEGLVVEEEEVEEPSDLQLHNETDVLQFYDGAATKPIPGKGSGEELGPEGSVKFSQLVGDWRKILSHGYVKPFKLDGHIWNSVTHYVEAQKFKNNSEFYSEFTRESGSELSQNVDMAKAAGAGKKYKTKQIIPKGIKPNDDWDEEKESDVLTKALEAKFSNQELADVLKATKDAKLIQYRKGRPARIEVELMRLRRKLQ